MEKVTLTFDHSKKKLNEAIGVPIERWETMKSKDLRESMATDQLAKIITLQVFLRKISLLYDAVGVSKIEKEEDVVSISTAIAFLIGKFAEKQEEEGLEGLSKSQEIEVIYNNFDRVNRFFPDSKQSVLEIKPIDIKFDHSKDKIYDALGIPKEQYDYICADKEHELSKIISIAEFVSEASMKETARAIYEKTKDISSIAEAIEYLDLEFEKHNADCLSKRIEIVIREYDKVKESFVMDCSKCLAAHMCPIKDNGGCTDAD